MYRLFSDFLEKSRSNIQTCNDDGQCQSGAVSEQPINESVIHAVPSSGLFRKLIESVNYPAPVA